MKKNRLQQNRFWGDGKSVIAIAHRGGGYSYGASKHKNENTLEAFSAVTKLGYKYIELDVIATADGEVVVLHVAKNRFEALARKKDAPNSKQLQMLTHAQMNHVLERDVPTLKQIIVAFPNTNFLIDAKSDDVVQPLAEIIDGLKAFNRVCVGSFYPRRLKQLDNLLSSRVTKRLIVSRSPWHLFHQLRYLKKVQHHSNHISAVDWPFILLNRLAVNWLHKHNLIVLAWTPNSHWSILRCLGLGVDGVISDKAELLKEVIISKDSNNPTITNQI